MPSSRVGTNSNTRITGACFGWYSNLSSNMNTAVTWKEGHSFNLTYSNTKCAWSSLGLYTCFRCICILCTAGCESSHLSNLWALVLCVHDLYIYTHGWMLTRSINIMFKSNCQIVCYTVWFISHKLGQQLLVHLTDHQFYKTRNTIGLKYLTIGILYSSILSTPISFTTDVLFLHIHVLFNFFQSHSANKCSGRLYHCSRELIDPWAGSNTSSRPLSPTAKCMYTNSCFPKSQKIW